MTTTDTELARSPEVFGCGGVQDLVERNAECEDGIGTAEVSGRLWLRSDKDMSSRLRATKTEVEAHGFRFEHVVVGETRSRGAG